jgi:hypothetical protein
VTLWVVIVLYRCRARTKTYTVFITFPTSNMNSISEYKLPSPDDLFKFDEAEQCAHRDFVFNEAVKYFQHVGMYLCDEPFPEDTNAHAEEHYQRLRWAGYELQEIVEHAYVRATIASEGKPPCIYTFSDTIYHETYDIEGSWEVARKTAIENQKPTDWPEYLKHDKHQQCDALWELYDYLNIVWDSIIHEFDTARRLYFISKKK